MKKYIEQLKNLVSDMESEQVESNSDDLKEGLRRLEDAQDKMVSLSEQIQDIVQNLNDKALEDNIPIKVESLVLVDFLNWNPSTEQIGGKRLTSACCSDDGPIDRVRKISKEIQ
jgi:predicted transcriptional regulator